MGTLVHLGQPAFSLGQGVAEQDRDEIPVDEGVRLCGPAPRVVGEDLHGSTRNLRRHRPMRRLFRRRYQQVMRDELVAAVEEESGRKVIAFMSDNHIEPDVAAEIFVLEREDNGLGPLPDANEHGPPSGV